ncbi:MAG TPA: extracellular solute-binding protein [Rectinemataceae bacterium]|nr:extracellular solute-binding protein [Rectinemataceae bacterium]
MTSRIFAVIALALIAAATATAQVTASYSLALHGSPKYPDGFAHFDYVNPDAPKGGMLREGTIGTYDNFNRFADRGVASLGADSYFFDTLMAGSLDEVDVYYPLIAEKVEYPADYSWIIFDINPRARAQDGKPITSDDVVFTFNKFMTEGVPQYRQYYDGVKAEALSPLRVKFTLKSGDKALAVSLASLNILPKSYWSSRKLSDPLTEVPVGTGAYTVKDYKIGEYVVYRRLPDYWAADLPVNKGMNNFDAIRYDYYRDETVAFEAFKAGEYDFYQESIAKNWATMYTGRPFDAGYIVKQLVPDQRPQPMQSFVFNVQRPIFQDRRVREALGYALDFQWLNKNFFYDQYRRTRSYFTNTDYEARGLPSADELRILGPIRSKIPPEVFTTEYQPPVTDGTGNIRDQIRTALDLFKDAGWEINKDGKLANVKTGQLMSFELLIYSPSIARIAAPIQKNLERMGVTMTIRQVDTTQYVNRMRNRDYDMIDRGYDAMYYPSLDVKEIWRSDYLNSTYNLAGIQDPAIDYLVDGIVANQANEKALLAWGRAFDRVLTWNFYVMPMWNLGKYRIAYWNKFGRPSVVPRYDLGLSSWWIDPAKEAALPKQ